MNFKGWVTLIKVNHSKHLQGDDSDSSRKGDKKRKIEVDVQSIYTKPPVEISERESRKFIKDANDSLKTLQGYVLVGTSFKKLPQEELGLFYKFFFSFLFFFFFFRSTLFNAN